jgi:hypothetical protein
MARTKRVAPGFDPAASDQVWEAISVLRSKLPAMTKFARIITGNDHLTVDITTGVPHTKGNKVFIRPPLGLGSKREHERSACGSRGEGGKQRCAACQLREVIDFYLFHELAHVIGKTQQLVTKKEIKKARIEALKLHPEGCDHHDQVMNRLAYIEQVGGDSMTLGDAFNPWLAMMINSLEDSRVNEMTFGSRPGMRTVFNMNMQRLLTEGSEMGEGKTLAWTEAPLDSQFIVGLQIAASGYAFEGEFAPEVMQALTDPKLVRLCQQAIHASTVFQIFNLALEVQKRAQELGYCKVEPCVVEPPAPEEPDLGSLGNPGGDEKGGTKPEGGTEDSSRPDDDAGSSDPASAQDDSPAASAAERDEAEGEDPAGDGGEDGGAGSGGDGGSGDGSGTPEPEDGGAVDDRGDGESGTEPGADTGSGAGGDEEGSGEAGDEPAQDWQVNAGTADNKSGSGGVGEPTDGQDGDAGASGDDLPADGSANTPDNAGISGPDSQEGAASRTGLPDSVQDAHGDPNTDVNELEGSVRDSGSEEVVSDSEDLAHESGERSESGETARDEGDRSDSGEPGETDAGERAEGDGKSDGDQDIPGSDAQRVDNPWDVEAPEHVDADGGAFDGPIGPVDGPESTGPVHGTPEDAARELARFLMHGDETHAGLLDDMATPEDETPVKDVAERVIGVPDDGEEYGDMLERLIELAMIQVDRFDFPSANVVTTEYARFPNRTIRWSPEDTHELQGFTHDQLATAFAPPEGLIGKTILHARTVFDANKRSHLDRNRKSGKINTRVLARRAPIDDPRLFAKKVIPKKRDYFVVLGGDASGSTSRYERNAKIKRALHAQAELLHRLQIPFAGYMHSAYYSSLEDGWHLRRTTGPEGNLLIWNYLLPFKEARDQWNEAAKIRLASINYVSQNLDGHTLEEYRKIAMNSTATDRIVIYYTDGEMPAENKEEETEILLREIDLYKKYGITLVCVGIQTDSPKRYGLPTVRVDSDEDLVEVIKFLDEILTK